MTLPRIGEIVLATVGNTKDCRCEVLAIGVVPFHRHRPVNIPPGADALLLRRANTGKPAVTFFRLPSEVRTTGDMVTANVFADWLEEHGELVAAAKLRVAFPLSSPPEA